MEFGISVRPGTAADVDAMYALDVRCFAEPFRFERELIERLACDPCAIVVVAHRKEVLVGFAIANLRRRRAGWGAYLSTLDVDPAKHRDGLGRGLMEETERRCAEAGASGISLHVSTENAAAVAFYERLGYKRLGRTTGYYGHAGDAWRYAKRLEQITLQI